VTTLSKATEPTTTRGIRKFLERVQGSGFRIQVSYRLTVIG
jgi:hypothetical protein